MQKLEFRALRADEIECRVAQVKESGCVLLLYKDARCDMNILDETVGAMNWQRRHTRDNANCIVSIWDSEKKQWIEKEDTGTESNTEKEKGLASDSFKRACFAWGIGRELYTAPFIWIPADKVTIRQNNGKYSTYDRFYVRKIETINKRIIALEIVDKGGSVVFSFRNASEIRCKCCGNIILGGKNKEGIMRKPEEVAEKTGGLCVACFSKNAT